MATNVTFGATNDENSVEKVLFRYAITRICYAATIYINSRQ